MIRMLLLPAIAGALIGKFGPTPISKVTGHTGTGFANAPSTICIGLGGVAGYAFGGMIGTAVGAGAAYVAVRYA